MVAIIYRHKAKEFNELKIAGGFNNWEIVPMQWSPAKEQWEYELDLEKIPAALTKIHFKFIDDQGNWFTDSNYAKEIDEHNNENNVKLLPGHQETATASDDKDVSYQDEQLEKGPITPAPSLVAEKTAEKHTTTEDPKPVPEALPEVTETIVEESAKALTDEEDTANSSEEQTRVEEEEPEQIEEVTDTNETKNTVIKGSDADMYKTLLQKIIEFFVSWFAWIRGDAK